jgi:4-hydroxy-tetrahydrodipicolinate reductase
MTKIVIAGAKGRMGQALLFGARQIPAIAVAGQIDAGDDLRKVIDEADVVVDFTFHESTAGLARICAARKKAMVIGTTGHTEAEQKEIADAAAQIPMVWASNFSTGVNVLFWLTRKAAETLGPEYDLEIVEMHHRFKKDAPSGTAMALADAVLDATGRGRENLAMGRHGDDVARKPGEVGIHSLRIGDEIGTHTVSFAALGERLELRHVATNRDTFVRGALRAAAWLAQVKKPGRYSLADVLN